MKIEKVKIKDIILNPNNPRIIKDNKFKKLVKSIKEFPEMLEVRPIVVDDDMVVLGGNMRLKACMEAGLKDVYIIKFQNLPEEKKKEFIVKDNIGYGEWDWELLNDKNGWDKNLLIEWGMDVPEFVDVNENENTEENYTRKVEAPIYEIKGLKPTYNELIDDSKYNEIINEIEQSDISQEDKKILKLSATRHLILNFENIAEYYAHSDKKIQELMEKQAMIIIDFNKAIELGFVKLNDEISKIYLEDYDE